METPFGEVLSTQTSLKDQGHSLFSFGRCCGEAKEVDALLLNKDGVEQKSNLIIIPSLFSIMPQVHGAAISIGCSKRSPSR